MRKLWGIDCWLEGSEDRFFAALPVFDTEGHLAVAQGHGWSATSKILPLDEHEAKDVYQPLAFSDAPEVSEDHVVLVMGPTYFQRLNRLGIHACADWAVESDSNFRVLVASRPDGEAKREHFATSAHELWEQAVTNALDKRSKHTPTPEAVKNTLRDTRDIVLRTAFHTRLELAHVDLITLDILGESTQYSHSILIFAMEFGLAVAELSALIEARLVHHVRAHVSTARSTQRQASTDPYLYFANPN